MEIVSVLYFVAGIVGIISCIIILIEFIDIHKPINMSVYTFKGILKKYLKGLNIIQAEKFLLMVNKGDDLCKDSEKIPYIDYINESNLFLGGKK